MLATRAEDTDPALPAVSAGPDTSSDLSAAWLQLQVAVDQLCKPERVVIERTYASEDEEKAARRALVNMLADYQATRGRARDGSRLEIERAAAAANADQLAERIKGYTRERVELPALLVQVRDAVESSTSTGQLGSSTHPAPIGLAAAALLYQIQRVVGRGDDPTLIDPVRHWAAGAGAWRTTAPDRLLEAARQAQEWVSDCRSLLNPERRFRPVRDTACPVCERTHAFLVVEGERRREPALLIDAQTGVTVCRACREEWPFERGRWLAGLLDEQREERRARRNPQQEL